jgi:hypothetical protein
MDKKLTAAKDNYTILIVVVIVSLHERKYVQNTIYIE